MSLPFTTRTFRTLVLVCLGAGTLTACTGLATRSDTDAPIYLSNSSESDGDYLLRMALRLRGATATELAAELEGLQRVFTARRSEDNRVRLAAFLAMAPSPYGDRGKALALLDVPPGENAGRGRNHPYAALFIPQLLDIRRAEDNQSIAQGRLKEEQKRSEALQQNAEAMRQSAEAMRQNAEAMRLKLEAIRDIEKKLLERPIQK